MRLFSPFYFTTYRLPSLYLSCFIPVDIATDGAINFVGRPLFSSSFFFFYIARPFAARVHFAWQVVGAVTLVNFFSIEPYDKNTTCKPAVAHSLRVSIGRPPSLSPGRSAIDISLSTARRYNLS